MLHCPPISAFDFSRLLLSAGLLLCASIVPALAADPTGDWRVEEGLANIRIAECNGSMWGAVSWEKIPGGQDTNNPDASKQSRPTLAMPILIDMKKKPNVDQWEGVVYNSKDGKSYKSTIKPVGIDKLEIQGCILGFLCGGETWTRVGDPIPSSPTNAAKGTKAAKGPAPTPKQTGAPKAAGQKGGTPGQAADIGDICLIPDIASPPPAQR